MYGRRKNRRARFIPGSEEWKSVDMEEPMAVPSAGDDLDTADSQSGGSDANPSSGISAIDHVRAPQAQSEVNFSVGGERGWAEKIEETPEMLAKRREGQKRAMEKELVKSAARRAVIFGLPVDARPAQASGRRTKGRRLSQIGQIETMRRKCEALMNGKVVEPSFAKGDWSIRWREEWPLHA